jgi:hypothetical protein
VTVTGIAVRVCRAAALTCGVLLASVALVLPADAAPRTATAGSAAPIPVGGLPCGVPQASTTQPGYLILDPHCDVPSGAPFAPLTDDAGAVVSDAYAGVDGGAAYRIEVPRRWNGELVVFAHGSHGTSPKFVPFVWVDNPELRQYYIDQGYAWAASSYEVNGADTGLMVRDTVRMLDVFTAVTGRHPHRRYITGESLGGDVTVTAIEHFPGTFAGAMPYCGVLGGVRLFDFSLDASVLAAALTGAPLTFPAQPGPDFTAEYDALARAELPLLGTGLAGGGAVTLTDLGQRWAAAIQQRSGGARPGFDAAFAWWNSIGGSPINPGLADLPVLLAEYPGVDGGTLEVADGNLTGNQHTVYRLRESGPLTPQERELNAAVLRVAPTATPSQTLSGLVAIHGTPGIPVLSLHGVDDLAVPLSMEQSYARQVAAHGQRNLFVSRAIRSVAHCDFTQTELRRGFDDLVRWVRTGADPTGDDILNQDAVADPAFGCRFTDGTHPLFTGTACPR